MMQSILEQLVDGVVDGPDDLMGIGECLNLLDRLEGCDEFPREWSPELAQVRKLFNRLILEDSPDPQADWTEIRRRMTSLHDGRGEGEPPAGIEMKPPNVDWQNIERLVDDLSPQQVGGKAPEAPAEEDSAGSRVPAAEEAPETMEIQDPELLKDFIEEAREHLSAIELNMLSLEADPRDQEAINAVFRPFHSIKGVAGFLNLKDIHHLSHEVENLLDAARAGTLVISDAVIDIVLTAVDILKVLLGELEEVQGQDTPILKASPLVAPFLERVKNFGSDEPVEAGTPMRKVGRILVEHGVVDSDTVESMAERTKVTGNKLGEELVLEGAASPRDVSRALREQRRTKENAASVRIDTLKLDNLVDMVGELVIAQSMVLQNPDVLRIKDQKLQKDSV
ncbi:MAG: Hpt domain-containing protein, partial [Desulfobacteraceae bacterium]|nr:Hpt domain-containing protein [Desulfobacteraceae bacterium]